MKTSAIKLLVTFGSVVSIGFGIWHFFVPNIWDWYSYIDRDATELVIAVRAINIFFSLVLVLLGISNVLIAFRKNPDKFSSTIILSISIILWMSRVILQIIYPQGSQNLTIQYSMLIIFILVFLSFTYALILLLSQKQHDLQFE